MRGIVLPSTSRVCVAVPQVAWLELFILSQDWPRHRRECAPVAPAHSNTLATPPPIQPQLVTVSAILFAPQEGIFDATCWRTHALSRASRSTSNHYRDLRAASRTCSRCLPDPSRTRVFPWRTGRQCGLDAGSEWRALAISSAPVVFSWCLGRKCSSKSGNFSHHLRCSLQTMVRSGDRPQVQWVKETGLF